MIRGTTPTHIFTFREINPSELKVLNIYYAQQGSIILKKEKTDCSFTSEVIEGETIYKARVSLSQEETNLFKDRYDVEIQLRALTTDDQSMATVKYRIPVYDVLDDEVLE